MGLNNCWSLKRAGIIWVIGREASGGVGHDMLNGQGEGDGTWPCICDGGLTTSKGELSL